MKKTKIILNMFLVVILLASLIAGCSSGTEGTEPQDAEESNEQTTETEQPATDGEPATEEEENKFEEHITITLGYPDIENFVKRDVDDAMLKHIEETFNITIEPVNMTWSDYGEKAKLWAASGQLPDITFSSAMDTDLANKWLEQGITRAVPQDLSKFPSLNKVIQLPDVQGYATESGLSFLPRQLALRNELPGDRTFFVRKDWMEKLGYSEDPDTYDELKQMLTEIVKNNPEGKNDVAGLAISGWLMEVFHNAFPQKSWWVKEGDRWIPGAMSDKFVEPVKLLRDFYQAGLIDKDFAIPNQDAVGKFAQGKAGLLLFQGKNIRQVEDKWKQYNPDIKFEDAVKLMKPIPASDGNQYLFSYYTFWSGTIINASVDDKKMERILWLFDYLLSPEGRKLTLYGFEGTDWEMQGDKLVIKREKDENGNLPALSSKYPSADVFNSLAAWVGFEGNFYGNDDHPGESDYAYTTRVQYDEEMLSIGKPLGIDWKVNAFVSTVPRTIAPIDITAEVTKIMVGDNDDVETLWRELATKIEQNDKAIIDAVNEKFE